MFKKTLTGLGALLLATNVLAEVNVTVHNTSKYDIELTSKEIEVSTYAPDPAMQINAGQRDFFQTYSLFPTVATIVDLEYTFTDSSIAPDCHFRFVVLKDARTGAFLPQPIIAENEGGSYRDRAVCSGTVDGFNLDTGRATVTFKMDRRKF
ncbi:hypothetical protein [Gynuella sunshinyii]|uniref:Uncharacterized protein n=1 Tax=Gynuella sunshinyii YC6258 TaxID=1445510 RepID=A0A0C5VCB9_9GAMM|nr:hypothetical protein [Gynuella sunshinyii]AJQ92142.1 hypothetical Protein YC6258_00086 [Gynuella sunshinyii YC6258]